MQTILSQALGANRILLFVEFLQMILLISGTGGNSDAIADYFSQLTQSEVDDDDEDDGDDGGDDDYDYFSQLTQC